MRNLTSVLLLVLISVLTSRSFGQDLSGDDLFLDGGTTNQPDIHMNELNFVHRICMRKDFLRFVLENDDETGSNTVWELNNDAPDGAAGVYEFGMGIGTPFPAEALHVFANDISPYDVAKIVVENQFSGTPQTQEMFALVNNGGSRFSFTDTSLDSKWIFSSDALGRFSVSLNETGGPELTIKPNGRVLMGGGGSQVFDLRPNGNLKIAGTLFQSSDKNLKTAFADVNNQAILKKVAEMPVTTWQFKSDEADMRHMGPTAQDFHAAFELGEDETSIAPVDGIGVSLAAIKALNEKLNRKISGQQTLIDSQQEMLEKLMQRLDALESR